MYNFFSLLYPKLLSNIYINKYKAVNQIKRIRIKLTENLYLNPKPYLNPNIMCNHMIIMKDKQAYK
jgi:hypothetical protein